MTKRNSSSLGEPVQYDPDFRGPLKRRSCTDIIFLVAFFVFIACWIGIAIYAYTSGDPQTLLVPVASDGSRCGRDSHVKDKPYLFFFDLTKCIDVRVPFTKCKTTQVCVKKCPSQYYNKHDTSTRLDTSFCSGSNCPEWYLPSKPFENRCVPLLDDTYVQKIINTPEFKDIGGKIVEAIKNFKVFSEVEEVGQNIVDDIISSWWQILIGIGVALFTSLLYILIMRWIAGIMVWFSIVGVIVLLGAGVYFTGKHYADLRAEAKNEEESTPLVRNQSLWLTMVIILSVLLLIILLVLVFLRKRILLAIELIKEGSKAVSSVTSVLFFPIFPWILQIGVMVLAISCGLYLASTGTPEYRVKGIKFENAACKMNVTCDPEKFIPPPSCQEATCRYIKMQNPRFYPYLQAINVFGFFWGAFFVSALGQMILASVFATWYWTYKKRNLPFFAVTEATGTVLRYHIGTLAFGSLIIAICRIIRVILEYIDHKLKKYDNELVKALMCCMKCFFWCLEKFLKFINRNAYIMCAIYGKNFCSSAKHAFLLLARNIIRVFVLDKVTDFLFFLSKVVLTVGVGAIAYVCFVTDLTSIDNSHLKYNIVPVIIIMVFTFFIATLFFNVYSMAVDTLFLCFLEDCERNDGSAEKPYYMSRDLMKIFGKKNKQH